jgi:hypothetical protein
MLFALEILTVLIEEVNEKSSSSFAIVFLVFVFYEHRMGQRGSITGLVEEPIVVEFTIVLNDDVLHLERCVFWHQVQESVHAVATSNVSYYYNIDMKSDDIFEKVIVDMNYFFVINVVVFCLLICYLQRAVEHNASLTLSEKHGQPMGTWTSSDETRDAVSSKSVMLNRLLEWLATTLPL